VTETAGRCPKLGLIVNPVAGLGGRVGLKGSDGEEIQKRALELGAVPGAQGRAAQALERVGSIVNTDIITWPVEMGEDVAKRCGLDPTVVGSIEPGRTSAEDTRHAAAGMLQAGVDLLLFAGGDGTARDICGAVGSKVPVLGIPAGVKIHSAAFATTPLAAGDLASLYLQGRVSALREAEVIDIDEEALRRGDITVRLFGYLKVPFRTSLIQSLKSASGPGEEAAMQAIAAAVVEVMEKGVLYIIGPGTTTREIMTGLGLGKTLVGVDVVEDGRIVASDANESQILSLIAGRRAFIVVTPIGGQGCIFGRGNQQISPEVIRRVGRENIIVVGTPGKLNTLAGRPLWVDTGDREVDGMLCGHYRVVTGYNEEAICRVSG
jgi:predicted polyphosphate/ATP-dependent NAD kinase